MLFDTPLELAISDALEERLGLRPGRDHTELHRRQLQQDEAGSRCRDAARDHHVGNDPGKLGLGEINDVIDDGFDLEAAVDLSWPRARRLPRGSVDGDHIGRMAEVADTRITRQVNAAASQGSVTEAKTKDRQAAFQPKKPFFEGDAAGFRFGEDEVAELTRLRINFKPTRHAPTIPRYRSFENDVGSTRNPAARTHFTVAAAQQRNPMVVLA